MHFLPDTEIFKENNDFHYEILAKRLRELSFLNNGVRIRLKDERSGKEDDFRAPAACAALSKFINKGKTVLHPTSSTPQGARRELRRHPRHAHRRGSGHAVERRLHRAGAVLHQQHPQRDGGTHLTGLRAAMTARHQQVHRRNELAKKAKVEVTGDDMREGLCCVLSR